MYNGVNLEMRDYELVAIISPEQDDGQVAEVIKRMGKLITDRGGTVEEVKQWGKKKLAYPIKKFLEGNYILTRFKLEPKLVREFEATLRTSEEILRYLVVKVGD
jgi:small subunit ribosomal protein S6